MMRMQMPERYGALYVCPAEGTEREQHTAAHALLGEALRDYAQERRIRLPDPFLLSRSKMGKPYIAELPEVQFNLSHCSGMAVCLISPYPCGVDVERKRPIRPKVVSRVFSAEEQALLADAKEPDMLFTQMWTLKESYVKAIGIGVSYPMREVCFSLDGNAVQSNRPDAEFWHTTEDGYAMSVCILRHPVRTDLMHTPSAHNSP